jgi:hypothetical protein
MGALFYPFPHPTVPSSIFQVKPMDGGFTRIQELPSAPSLGGSLILVRPLILGLYDKVKDLGQN